MSSSFDMFLEFLQKLGFRLVGVFDYSQLDPNARERCSPPPCSVAIEIPAGRISDQTKIAIVAEIRYASNTNLVISRIARCVGQEVKIEEAQVQVF